MNLEERKGKFEGIYYGTLGMCGCGRPEEVKQFLFDLSENHRKHQDDEITWDVMYKERIRIIKTTDADVIFEVIFHVFEKCGLLYHGSSVHGSWFTKEGSDFLKLLAEFKDVED